MSIDVLLKLFTLLHVVIGILDHRLSIIPHVEEFLFQSLGFEVMPRYPFAYLDKGVWGLFPLEAFHQGVDKTILYKNSPKIE